MGSNNKAQKRPRVEVPEEDVELTGIPDNAGPKSKKAKTEASNSLFVRSLPPSATNESLAEFFSEHFPVKHATVILDASTKQSRGFGFVTFTDAEDALEAKNKLNNELWDGRRITIDVAEARHRDQHGPSAKPAHATNSGSLSKEEAIEAAWKSPKLIIRNLPWSIKTRDDLAALFRSYGKIKFADLPQKHGRLRGFGFVTIRGQKNAETAIAGVNGKVVDGRTLAVDWAVEKREWEQRDEEEGDDEPAKEKKQKEKKPNKEAAAKPADSEADAQLNADLENFLKKHMEHIEDESSENEDEDDDDEEEDEIDEDEDEESAEEDDNSTKPQKTTDNTTTIFVRNLPFTTTDEQLKGHFIRFGPVRYARVVMDRATDRPAGTGFVCFVNEADSKTCVKNAPRPQGNTAIPNKNSILQDETADPEGKYTLDGRLLHVAQAVSKDDASRLAADGGVKRRANDKRRLFLLEEGQLDTRSPMYQNLSPSEIKMREQSRSQRKKLVERNPTLHISLTRLAVRNLPTSINSKDLKQLAREACVGFASDVKAGLRQPLSKEEKSRANQEAKEAEHHRRLKKKGIVSQAKIEFEARDGSKVAETTGGKSRGYGFIEYSSHRWALMGLRWLNGHLMENDNGRKQRLIVEFAIENAQVVRRRKAGEEKQQQRRDEGDAGGAGNNKDDEEEEDEEANKPKSKKDSRKPKMASNKSNKKFALKTGGAKGPSKAEGDKKKPGKPDSSKPIKADKKDKSTKPDKAEKSGKPKPGEVSREDVQQKLIARKRLMRKKKAQSRK